MSAEVERLFSSLKLSLIPQQRKMHDDTLEMIKLLRHWWRNEVTIYDSNDEGSSDGEDDE